MQFSLTLKTDEWDRAVDELGERALRAGARALNRTAATVRTFMARTVAQDLGLGVRTVSEQLRVEQAKPVEGLLLARITVTGAQIPLYDFKARASKGGGVIARLPPPGAGRYPEAFIARMKSGHVGVFQRKGRPRLPIRELRGPSLPHVFSKYIPQGLTVGQDVLPKNFAHELGYQQSLAG